MKTAVIGVGSLGAQHARIHSELSVESRSEFVGVCDTDGRMARAVAALRGCQWTCDWRTLVGRVDAVSLAVPTESHCEIACQLLEAGIHVLVEKPIARSLAEADQMIATANKSGVLLQVGHLERFNPAMIALRPYVKAPLYFEIHRIGQFTTRSLDIDVVLDLMIHDLDIVQWLVGRDVDVTDVRAVGIPVLTDRVDAANVRLEFATGAVANITASRIGTEKIRKMRFFQPHDYIAVDYTTRRATISSLMPSGDVTSSGMHPGITTRLLDIIDVEPLRAEIEAFLIASETGAEPPVSGAEGRRALEIALRAQRRISEKRSVVQTAAGFPITSGNLQTG